MKRSPGHQLRRTQECLAPVGEDLADTSQQLGRQRPILISGDGMSHQRLARRPGGLRPVAAGGVGDC
jgi:hypothetical protein